MQKRKGWGGVGIFIISKHSFLDITRKAVNLFEQHTHCKPFAPVHEMSHVTITNKPAIRQPS